MDHCQFTHLFFFFKIFVVLYILPISREKKTKFCEKLIKSQKGSLDNLLLIINTI